MTNLKTGILLLSALYLAGCQNNNSTTATNKDQKEALNKDQKEASKYTLEANEALYKSYPFDDKQSFTDATKGLIAVLPNEGIIKDDQGKTVWNLKAFTDFITQGSKSPNTVNPSLWRQSQLLMLNGLFEVVPGVYQVRGADLSNLTIVEGQKGIAIYDPLVTAETAKAALELYYSHRGKKPVVAVIYTHSHADHFGGVRGVASQADVDAGKTKIYAPEGFLNDAIAENVYAGTAMSRRASYMYGNALPPGPQGQVGAGLGITTSSGNTTLIAPTDIIYKTGEKKTIDGIEYEFLMAPGSEAPSEMMWYLPKFKLVNTAEDAVHTMHNLYTLRGAKTRDASKWPEYLNQLLMKWGSKTTVAIGMHHWPVWGQENVVKYIKAQRDTYKFMHDQTLHFANMGFTMNELPDKVVIPKGLVDEWGTHGYYGTQSHDVRAIYNYYLGYFDGNPAHLNPLPPEEVGNKYVAAMGGAQKVLALGNEALEKGEYRWGAELVNHLVFAEPANQDARNLQADLLEQMGYQAESGPWRNFYLAGAKELRNGLQKFATPNTSSPDIIQNMSLDLFFGYMGIQLDAQKANGQKITINYNFPDTKQKYTVFLENSVLNAWSGYQDSHADATITMNRSTLNKIMTGQLKMEDALAKGEVKIDGNAESFKKLMSMVVDLGQSFWFNIIEP